MTQVYNLESLLVSLTERTDGDKVTVRDLLNAVGRRSYGPILLLLGFVAISPLTIIPGANWMVALITLIVALQIVIGRPFPWVPRRLLDLEFERKHLTAGVDAMRKYVHIVDRLMAPRLTFLTDPPFAQLVALICVAAAAVSIPLGLFPFGPVLPGLTVLLFGLGLTARDGIVLSIAAMALFGAVLLMVRVIPRLSGQLTAWLDLG